jgi:hypothetical protein
MPGLGGPIPAPEFPNPQRLIPTARPFVHFT